MYLAENETVAKCVDEVAGIMDDVDENKIIVFPSDNTSAGRDHILQQICRTEAWPTINVTIKK